MEWNAETIGEELVGPGLKVEVKLRVRINGICLDLGPVSDVIWENGMERAVLVIGEQKEEKLPAPNRNGYDNSEREEGEEDDRG